MYHAIMAKDYKPLQKLLGFGVRLLQLHGWQVPVWAGCSWAVPEPVPAGSEMQRIEYRSVFTPGVLCPQC